MKKNWKSEEQEQAGEKRPMPSDPFDIWLAMLGTFIIEPVIDVFRAARQLIRGKRSSVGPGAQRRLRRRSRGHRRRRDKS